jgi:hypothetical protein
MTFNPDIHNCRSIRLRDYDYAAPCFHALFLLISIKHQGAASGAPTEHPPNPGRRLILLS